jgi:repressor LexA
MTTSPFVPTMPPLEPLQQAVYDFIRLYSREQGFAPGIREIAAATTRRSIGLVQRTLDELEASGYIQRQKGKKRSIRVLYDPDQAIGVPIWGTIAAGGIVESFPEPEPERLIEVAERYKTPEYYGLRVIGDSMIGSHICSGDLVILRQQVDVQSLKNGSIVAAEIAGEGTTLKHFRRIGNQVRLIPANPQFKEIKVTAAEVRIQGVVVEVRRHYQPFRSA